MQQYDYQAAFTKAYLGLLHQGVASVEQRGALSPKCLYRADNGNKCAVGHLIPDALYVPELENVAISDPSAVMTRVLNELFPGHDKLFLEFLCEMQVAHDSVLKNNGINDWCGRMGEIADNYGLVVPT